MEKLTKFKTSINKFPIKNKEDEQNERLRKIHTFQATIKDFEDYINQRIEDTKIEEKLTLNDISKMSKYRYQPKDKEELISLLNKLIKERGNEGNFNDIDTSLITDMSKLFYDNKTFNGNISEWNTSKVTYMCYMFKGAESFNQPIGGWDTSKVTDMHDMFRGATSFNQPIGDWNTSKVTDMDSMFQDAISFNQPIYKWKTPKVTDMGYMFCGAKSFNKDISNWKVNNVKYKYNIFNNCPIKEEHKPKFK